MPDSRVAVGIVGAGPAGLLLGHLLHLAGIDSVTVEIRSESHVIERVRAGVLEQGSVDLLHQTGLGARLAREGMRHEGLFLAFNGERHHVDLAGLTGGRAITVYGQNEVVRDLLAARHQAGARLLFEAEDVRLSDVESDRPRLHAREEGHAHVFTCDYLVGCDGSHGISRPSLPAGAARIYEGVPPFAWLGVLARAAPSSHQLVYSLHERGFALFSMRTPEITRLYLQCPPDDAIEQWSDDRIWDELLTRLHTRDGWRPTEGPILQKSITGLRSVVTDPMRCGRLFLAGDAAHIVPADGRQGPEPGDRRRLAARGCPCGPLSDGEPDRARRVLRSRRPAHLAGAAVLVVDDVHAAQNRRRRHVPLSPSNRGSRLSRQLAGRDDRPGRELRRAAAGVSGAGPGGQAHARVAE